MADPTFSLSLTDADVEVLYRHFERQYIDPNRTPELAVLVQRLQRWVGRHERRVSPAATPVAS